jgi:hypothetical protein
MNFGQIKTAASNYLARNSDSFTLDDQVVLDLLTTSVNLAQVYAQRQVDFFLAAELGMITLDTSTGVAISNATLDDGVTALSVKRFLQFYSDEDRTIEIPFLTAKDKYRDTALPSIYIYQFGNKLYLVTGGENTGTQDIYFTCYKLLDDLDANSDSNFLTDYCADWLVMQTVIELQNFIREDDRIAISAGLIRNKWDTVLVWNSSFERETDLSLD